MAAARSSRDLLDTKGTVCYIFPKFYGEHKDSPETLIIGELPQFRLVIGDCNNTTYCHVVEKHDKMLALFIDFWGKDDDEKTKSIKQSFEEITLLELKVKEIFPYNNQTLMMLLIDGRCVIFTLELNSINVKTIKTDGGEEIKLKLLCQGEFDLDRETWTRTAFVERVMGMDEEGYLWYKNNYDKYDDSVSDYEDHEAQYYHFESKLRLKDDGYGKEGIHYERGFQIDPETDLLMMSSWFLNCYKGSIISYRLDCYDLEASDPEASGTQPETWGTTKPKANKAGKLIPVAEIIDQKIIYDYYYEKAKK